MAHLAGIERSTQPRYHVVAGQAFRLIHDDESGAGEGICHGISVCRTLWHVKILHGLGAVPDEVAHPHGSVVTIGVFDGVHKGHQLLINMAVDTAHKLGLPSVVLTFDPHPREIFAPGSAPAALLPLSERSKQIEQLGVDYLLVVDFRVELAGESPDAYVREVLVEKLAARHVLVGENFTFGRNAEGTAETMAQLGRRYGFEVTIVQLLDDAGVRICSTAIRQQLAGGDIQGATDFMGRPFSLIAKIERGAGRGGRELGYPTANQYASEHAALPGDGVYAGWLTIIDEGPIAGDMRPGVRYPAAISVGTNPTFGDQRRSVESYILDRDADLYDRVARVEFVQKVRDMEKFDSVDELLDHMARDVASVRDILGIQ